jgi:hypothetical protein
MEIIRTIANGKDSVPHAVVTTSGTFTGTGRRLAYAGSDDLRLLLNKYANVWLFFPTAGLLVRVHSYSANVVWLTPGTNITLSGAETGNVVEGLLVSYQLENVGNGSAYVNGQNLNAGFPLNMRIREGVHDLPKTLDPVLVDTSSGTSVRVVEQR